MFDFDSYFPAISFVQFADQGYPSFIETLIQLAYPLETKYGGPPRVSLTFAKFLSSHFNLKTVYVGPTSGFDTELEQHGNYIWEKPGAKSKYRLIFNFSRVVRRELRKSDIILMHGFYFPQTLLAILYSRNRGRKYLMPHGVFEEYQQNHSRLRKWIFDLFLRAMGFPLGWHFLVASESEISGVKLQYPNVPITCVGLYPDEEFPISEATKELKDKIQLVHCGRLTEKKRLDLSIKALRLGVDSGLDLSLILIGDGDFKYKRTLSELVELEGMTDRVIFYGNVTGENRFHLMAAADIFLLPSENENFAIAVLEALSCGLPCIVSEYVATNTLIKDLCLGSVLNELTPSGIKSSIDYVLTNYQQISTNISKNYNLQMIKTEAQTKLLSALQLENK